jgi:hypothetical protein
MKYENTNKAFLVEIYPPQKFINVLKEGGNGFCYTKREQVDARNFTT